MHKHIIHVGKQGGVRDRTHCKIGKWPPASSNSMMLFIVGSFCCVCSDGIGPRCFFLGGSLPFGPSSILKSSWISRMFWANDRGDLLLGIGSHRGYSATPTAFRRSFRMLWVLFGTVPSGSRSGLTSQETAEQLGLSSFGFDLVGGQANSTTSASFSTSLLFSQLLLSSESQEPLVL